MAEVYIVVVTEKGYLYELICYGTEAMAAKRIAFMKRALGEDSPFEFEIRKQGVID